MGAVQSTILGVLTSLSAASCVPVDGGAIELSWQFRSQDGDVLPCDELAIEKVRLIARPADGRVVSVTDYRFDCDRDVGTTDFEFPEGDYAISIQPLCGDGAFATPAERVVLPPPIRRRVRRGELTQLNALLVIAEQRPACPIP